MSRSIIHYLLGRNYEFIYKKKKLLNETKYSSQISTVMQRFRLNVFHNIEHIHNMKYKTLIINYIYR